MQSKRSIRKKLADQIELIFTLFKRRTKKFPNCLIFSIPIWLTKDITPGPEELNMQQSSKKSINQIMWSSSHIDQSHCWIAWEKLLKKSLQIDWRIELKNWFARWKSNGRSQKSISCWHNHEFDSWYSTCISQKSCFDCCLAKCEGSVWSCLKNSIIECDKTAQITTSINSMD